MRPSSQGVSGGTQAVKSCLSPFLQTISDISLDNTTLSPCRPRPPPPGPPTAASAVYSWALTIGILTWRSGRPALPSDPPSPWQLEPGRPGLCVRITDPEFTILLSLQAAAAAAATACGIFRQTEGDRGGRSPGDILRHRWNPGMAHVTWGRVPPWGGVKPKSPVALWKLPGRALRAGARLLHHTHPFSP